MVFDAMNPRVLPAGIVSVLQTPFEENGQLDLGSLANLVEHAIEGRVAGILAPAVASEVTYLSQSERDNILQFVSGQIGHRVPFIVGASGSDPKQVAVFARKAEELQAEAYLVAVPNEMYGSLGQVRPFFQEISKSSSLPLVIQDLEWNGPGLPLRTICELATSIPTLRGFKIETVPAGPKYSAVKEALGDEFWVSGGWAVPQMIEALDRGVDAMIPESSMCSVYSTIITDHRKGNRDSALGLFRRLLPILAFTNQELAVSIAFFKRLLRRKGVIKTERMRHPGFRWDRFSERVADELIDLFFELEKEVELSK